MKMKIILILGLLVLLSGCNLHKNSVNNVAMEESCYLAYYYDNNSFDIEKTYDFIYKEKSSSNVYCQFYYKLNNTMEKQFYSANIKFDDKDDIYYYNGKVIFTWDWHNKQYESETSEFKTRFEIVRDYINSITEKESSSDNSMMVTINNKQYMVKLEDNETVKSFANLLPIELNMSELNGNEKYVYLDNTLPTNSFNPRHIEAGDVMLYGNNCLVIFYKSFDTSYSYTKIGHIDNLDELGNGNIIVKFE